MKKIDQNQLQKFYDFLNTVNSLFPLDMENIVSVIENKSKKTFPQKENTAIILAVNKEVSDKCLVYIPVVAVTSAPNHLSDHVGVLELKIMKKKLLASGGVEFISSVSVFPSGRMVFLMKGVRLDSNGKSSLIEEDVAFRDHKFYNDDALIVQLRAAMLGSFKASDPVAIEDQRKLLSLFSKTHPESN
jgi:hypothetical protein